MSEQTYFLRISCEIRLFYLIVYYCGQAHIRVFCKHYAFSYGTPPHPYLLLYSLRNNYHPCSKYKYLWYYYWRLMLYIRLLIIVLVTYSQLKDFIRIHVADTLMHLRFAPRSIKTNLAYKLSKRFGVYEFCTIRVCKIKNLFNNLAYKLSV